MGPWQRDTFWAAFRRCSQIRSAGVKNLALAGFSASVSHRYLRGGASRYCWCARDASKLAHSTKRRLSVMERAGWCKH